ncbi:MAG: glycogen-binding domain-containing protein [Planctomycetota bacterium]|nr:glycogen-binding domain-containing protein [Planctomycetota bacterium]
MVTVNGTWVDFSFFRPQAKNVRLTGGFNGCQEGELRMTRDSDGYWRLRLRLPAGKFKFRYCADGEWFADYASFGVEQGRFGLNSIVRVEAPPLGVTQPAVASEVAAA